MTWDERKLFARSTPTIGEIKGAVVYFDDDKVECRFGDYTVFFSRKLFDGFNLFPGAPLQIIECKDENAAEKNKDIFELWDGIETRAIHRSDN